MRRKRLYRKKGKEGRRGVKVQKGSLRVIGKGSFQAVEQGGSGLSVPRVRVCSESVIAKGWSEGRKGGVTPRKKKEASYRAREKGVLLFLRRAKKRKSEQSPD